MSNFVTNKIKNSVDINDEVIASNMMVAAAGLANAYLNAALTSPTPELKAMYSSSLSQVLAGHAAITELAIKRGWAKPYNPPVHQLSESFGKSQSTVTVEKN